MTSADNITSEEPSGGDNYVYERLAPHREGLERLAELDINLSDDARRALQLLDDQEQDG